MIQGNTDALKLPIFPSAPDFAVVFSKISALLKKVRVGEVLKTKEEESKEIG